MKASTVVTPTRPRVQGSAVNTTWLTDWGKKVKEVPKCPVKELPK